MRKETMRGSLEPGQDSRARASLLRLLLVLLLLLLGLEGACALPKAELLILHVNDFHGQIQPRKVQRLPGRPPVRMGGFATLQAYVAKARREHAHVWLTDGGDWFQGTPEGNEDFGLSVMACRRRLDLTAAVVGNHEFDFGEENLMRILEGVDHPILGANILERDRDRERGSTEQLRPYVRPYLILPVGGLRVALVGLTAGNTEEVSTGPFGRASFADEVETLRRLWPELQEQADEVVLLSHCGLERDIQLAREFPGLLLILGGHSHTALWRGHQVGRTWIVQGRGRGTSISRVLLRVEEEVEEQVEGEVEAGQRRLLVVSVGLVPLITEKVGEDAAAARFLARQFAHIGAKWDVPLAQLSGARDRRTGPGSTPAGNYVAELIRRAGAAELGVTNKGGLRAALSHGALTRRMVFEFLPFDNTVVCLRMSGAELWRVLAQGLRPGRQPLEIAGGSYGYRVVGGKRELAWLRVGGGLVAEERMYEVATNSFLAAGGDGFTLFSGFSGPRHRRSGTRFLRHLMLEDLARSGSLQLVDQARIQVVD